MKKLFLLGIGSALMFTMGGVGPAQADTSGTTHKSTAVGAGQRALLSDAGGGRCASCHRAHTAKAEYLLKDAQPALCYTCHGGPGSGIDVVDGISNDNSQPLRGGGFEYALIDGANASKTMGTVAGAHGLPALVQTVPVLGTPAPVTSRHQIDGTTSGTMWGNGAISDIVNPGKAGVILECGSCHDPHGNGNYRILRPVPNDSADGIVLTPAVKVGDILPDGTTATVAVPAVMGPAPVNIPDAVAKVYTTTDYWAVADRNVPTVKGSVVLPVAGQTDGYIANVSQWCSTCHTRYLAGSGSYQIPNADASGKVDALFTYRHRSDRTDKAGVSRPNCIQCHVAHGTSATASGRAATFTAPDGLVPVPAGTSATVKGLDGLPMTVGGPAIGTSRLLRINNRGTCVMCHNV